MSRRRQWSAWSLSLFLAAGAAAEPLVVRIDAARQAPAISPLVFGGFMEPATTRVWAEMLADRKFFNRVTSQPDPKAVTGGFGRRGPQRRWLPIGPDAFVDMDATRPFVGEWSPVVKVEGTTPHGIGQSGLALQKGRAYAGRVALAGSAGAKVSVSLVWGPGPGDRQTILAPPLTERYAKVPLRFTAGADTTDGRLEIVGTGAGTFRVGVASLMPADNISGFRASTIRRLKELGIEIARWPGGNFVSAYDWRDGIGDRDKRPPRRELAWSGLESNDMGIDDFMTFCRLIGAVPYLAVNSGLGDAHSAAEEVEYVNGAATTRLGRRRAANGHPAPYGVRIWGVGNEMYGPWQWGHLQITQYAEKHNLMVRAMRKVDPTIEVIASGATPEEASWCYIENRQLGTFPERETVSDPLPFPFGGRQDWTGALLERSAENIDYLGEHFYGYPNLYVDRANLQFVPSDEPMALKVRRLANRVQFKFEAWDEYVKRMPSLKERNIRFAFDEWSPRNRAVGGGTPPVNHPMLNPLTNALVYHEFFRHSDEVGLAVATSGMGAMSTDPYGEAVGLRLEGLVMKALHDHFAGARPVAVDGDSPQPPVKGVVGIDTSARPSGSPTFPLDVFAALRADGRRMAVSMVNPTEAPQECELRLAGVEASGPATVRQVTAPSTPAAAAPGWGPFNGPPATMAESTLSETPKRVTLPPASLTVYEFDVRPGAPPKTAANPIIHADVPDMAMVRVGDTYYMSSTTMHLSPGLPIMVSKDLVNWRLVSYAYDVLDHVEALDLQNGKNAYGRGSWASSLRYRDGTFYATTFSGTTNRTYVYTTEDPVMGPWKATSFTPSLHDHSLFFDDDGRVYMLYGGGDLRLAELAPDLSGLKPGGFHDVVVPNASRVGGEPIGLPAEGSQLLKHEGRYYLVNITWPKGGIRTVIVHRAERITGPYEGRLAFQDRGIAQGSLVDTPDGRWFAYLFRDFGAVGRIPYLLPVEWKDGWPVFGVDGRAPDTLDLPPSRGLVPGLVASDEFDRAKGSPALPLVWQWNHSPDDARWSLTERPGFLRLTTGRVDADLVSARNTLTQRTFGPASSGTTSVDASGLKDGDVAGLGLLQKGYGFVGVKREGDARFVVAVTAEGGTPVEAQRVPLAARTVHLRAECDFRDQADTARFFYSLDGREWAAIGGPLKMKYTLPHFMGYRFALFSFATKAPGGSADFDYFRVSDRIVASR